MPIRKLRIQVEDLDGDEQLYSEELGVEVGKTCVIAITPTADKRKRRTAEVVVLNERSRYRAVYKKLLPD